MVSLLKRMISQVIAHSIIGHILFYFRKRVRYFGIKVSLENPYIGPGNKAAIYWNLYESAEARLISRYMQTNLTMIELGSSLGIISRLIGFRLQSPLICIEANKELIPSIEYNLKDIPNLNYRVLNKAISYSPKPILFSVERGKNLTGKVNSNYGDLVDTITLKRLIQISGINEYALVMDIEGSEIEIFLHDQEALINCRLMIAELHKTNYNGQDYSIEDLMQLIKDIGFTLIIRDGNCFAYKR